MYRIYPTLLNSFALFEEKTTDSQGEIIVDMWEMLDRINRVKKPTTAAQQKGIDFEKAVVTGENEDEFKEGVIEKARALLPSKYKTQFYSEAKYKNCLIYGFVDLVGGDRAVDLKSTRRYEPKRFEFNHQNLYLLGLKKYGIKTLDYVITDFEEVYQETYTFDAYDFKPLYQQIDNFVDFLEQHKKLIKDKKIFDNRTDNNQLSLF
ncbi:hypothetical protein LV89_04116 [Arcicella aurantiaca]|uniref:PD-(D/E)XK nuclease superfamily protein n=1 Tax=Arcicella aurantiaca TaxID=591202 RepID=A0A316DJJ7_9BACT|nr:hypothetical protein [Arcicella aurantiaca]PWK18417.1 hypothetical protein LV89_04116 [Arcicella aurantiaca]